MTHRHVKTSTGPETVQDHSVKVKVRVYSKHSYLNSNFPSRYPLLFSYVAVNNSLDGAVSMALPWKFSVKTQLTPSLVQSPAKQPGSVRTTTAANVGVKSM